MTENSLAERLADTLHIVFDGPPGPTAGRFVEVETPDGRSINAGEWHERSDGYWELRITRAQEQPAADEVGEPVAWMYSHARTEHTMPFIVFERDEVFAKLEGTIETPLYTAAMLECLAGPTQPASVDQVGELVEAAFREGYSSGQAGANFDDEDLDWSQSKAADMLERLAGPTQPASVDQVAQCDRDAAADLYKHLFPMPNLRSVNVRLGSIDDGHAVQAFAAHRALGIQQGAKAVQERVAAWLESRNVSCADVGNAQFEKAAADLVKWAYHDAAEAIAALPLDTKEG